MAAYSLSDTHILRMPIKRFWLLEKNISRMQAEEALRQLPVATASNLQGEGLQELANRLSREIGTVVKVTRDERDPDATQKLKRLSGKG